MKQVRGPVRRWASALTCLAVVCLAACSAGEGKGGEADSRNVHMKVGAFVFPSPSIMSRKLGLFNDLNVKFTDVESGSATLPLLQNGELSAVLEFSAPPPVLGIARGVDLRVVWMSAWDQDGFTVAKKIRNAADLKGKKVGVVTGTVSEYMLDRYLRKHSMSPSDVKKVEVPPGSMPAALKTGQIVGGYVWAPAWRKMAAVPGAHVIGRAKDPAFDAVSGKFADEHPQAVQKLVCDLAEGHKRFFKDPAKGYKLIGKGVGQTPRQVRSLMPKDAVFPVKQATPQALGDGTQPSTLAKFMHKTGTWLHRRGKVDTVPSVDKLQQHIDYSFAKGVAAGKC